MGVDTTNFTKQSCMADEVEQKSLRKNLQEFKIYKATQLVELDYCIHDTYDTSVDWK